MNCCDCPRACHVYTKRVVAGAGHRETYTCWMCHKRCNPSFAPQRVSVSNDKRNMKLLELKTMRMAQVNRTLMRDDAWA